VEQRQVDGHRQSRRDPERQRDGDDPRAHQPQPASPIPDTFETQETDGRFRSANANTQISYRLGEKKTITLSGG
jgi:hypothetical protein